LSEITVDDTVGLVVVEKLGLVVVVLKEEDSVKEGDAVIEMMAAVPVPVAAPAGGNVSGNPQITPSS
jgi:hypothetical protein